MKRVITVGLPVHRVFTLTIPSEMLAATAVNIISYAWYFTVRVETLQDLDYLLLFTST